MKSSPCAALEAQPGTLRRLFADGEQRARAKAMPLGELSSITRNHGNERTSCVIANESQASDAPSQRSTFVQVYSPSADEQRLIAKLAHMGLASAQRLADELGWSPSRVDSKLTKLGAKGLVVSARRGWRVK